MCIPERKSSAKGSGSLAPAKPFIHVVSYDWVHDNHFQLRKLRLTKIKELVRWLGERVGFEPKSPWTQRP